MKPTIHAHLDRRQRSRAELVLLPGSAHDPKDEAATIALWLVEYLPVDTREALTEIMRGCHAEA